MPNIYLKEFQYFNGEYNVIFNIIDLNIDKMTITLALTRQGKISVLEYDLYTDKDGNLFFEYGCEYTKIKVDDFED